MALVREDRPPPLTDGDTVIRSDAEWIAAAQEFITAKQLADDAAATLDALKQRLTGLALHSNEQGGGVSVARYWKTGAINYKNVPELAGVDLEVFRSAPREEVRVTVQK